MSKIAEETCEHTGVDLSVPSLFEGSCVRAFNSLYRDDRLLGCSGHREVRPMGEHLAETLLSPLVGKPSDGHKFCNSVYVSVVLYTSADDAVNVEVQTWPYS